MSRFEKYPKENHPHLRFLSEGTLVAVGIFNIESLYCLRIRHIRILFKFSFTHAHRFYKTVCVLHFRKYLRILGLELLPDGRFQVIGATGARGELGASETRMARMVATGATGSVREWPRLNPMAPLTRNAANDATMDNIGSEKQEYIDGPYGLQNAGLDAPRKKKLKIDGPYGP